MAETTVYVRDATLARVAQVSRFLRLEMALRFNRVSAWSLKLPASEPAIPFLAWGANVGIVVVRNGAVVLSGPVRRLDRASSASEDSIAFSGYDDMLAIQNRLALPVPAGPPYGGAAYDVRTGAAETIIKQYVNVNAGPGARADRRLPGLNVVATAGAGATVTGRARFDNLLELIQSLATAAGNLGFRARQNALAIDFDCYVPTDRSATAKFSYELGNLLEFSYSVDAATANYVFVGGSGEDTARVFAETSDPASIVKYGRAELFRDRRDTADAALMLQSAAEELASKADIVSLAIKPVETAYMVYGTDYALGDIVTVTIGGADIVDVLREVTIQIAPESGEIVTPVLTSPSATRSLASFDLLRRIDTRLRNLERR